jgi:hypothetical protein
MPDFGNLNTSFCVCGANAPLTPRPAGLSRGTIRPGIEHAVAAAKAAASDKTVGIGDASGGQQALHAELIDEVFVHVAPCEVTRP